MTKTRLGQCVFGVLVAILALYGSCYSQINSGLKVISGDHFDGVIQAILISHWYETLIGHQHWSTPLYFYPYGDVLGYNDTYFVYGLIASVYRAFGAGILIASELCLMTVRAIGFFSMLGFLRFAGCRTVESVLGAALFTMWLAVSIQSNHGQLLAVGFAPLMAYLLLRAKRGLEDGRQGAAVSWLSAFIVLYGGMLLSCFYMAWFFGLFAILFIVAYAIVFPAEMAEFWGRIVAARKFWPLVVAVSVVSLTPFLVVYIPVLMMTGGHGYQEQLAYALFPWDFLNVGWYSSIWHPLFARLYGAMPYLRHDGEATVGLTPDVALIVGVAAVYAFKQRDRLLISLAAAIFIALLLPVAVQGHSLWFFVDHIVPGGKGMRVIARFYLFLAFPIVVLVSMFLKRLPQLLSAAMLLFFCVSQVDAFPSVHLDVGAAMSNLKQIPEPPPSCRSFYVSNAPTQTSLVMMAYSHNVQAMLIADKIGLPTVNGIATFMPPDWPGLYDDGYPNRVQQYIQSHQLKDICALDMQNVRWRPVS